MTRRWLALTLSGSVALVGMVVITAAPQASASGSKSVGVAYIDGSFQRPNTIIYGPTLLRGPLAIGAQTVVVDAKVGAWFACDPSYPGPAGCTTGPVPNLPLTGTTSSGGAISGTCVANYASGLVAGQLLGEDLLCQVSLNGDAPVGVGLTVYQLLPTPLDLESLVNGLDGAGPAGSIFPALPYTYSPTLPYDGVYTQTS